MTSNTHIAARPLRVDALLHEAYPHLSQRERATLCDEGNVVVNGVCARKGMMLAKGEALSVTLTESQAKGTLAANPDVAIHILFEDDAMLALAKERACHTVANAFSDTNALVNGVKAYVGKTITEGGVVNAGSVNRLDYETSGIVLVAKQAHAYTVLRRMFADEAVEKYYLACVMGKPPVTLAMEDVLGGVGSAPPAKVGLRADGRVARADATLLETFCDTSVLLVRLHTGVRHQIRVQLALRGYPILGDTLYGVPGNGGMCLHAYMLLFRHPESGRRMLLTAPLPDDFFANIVCAVEPQQKCPLRPQQKCPVYYRNS